MGADNRRGPNTSVLLTPRVVPELEPALLQTGRFFPISFMVKVGIVLVIAIVGLAVSESALVTVASHSRAGVTRVAPVGSRTSTSAGSTSPATTTSGAQPTSDLTQANNSSSTLTPTAVGSSSAAVGSSPNPTPAAYPFSQTIQASGIHLILNGAATHFVGVNAYEAATDWGTNAGCGGMLTDAQMDGLFASLPPNSLVRIIAFQATMATDVNTGQLNWAPLDRVFASAAAHDQKLIPVMSGQGSGCDGGHWQDIPWYDGGFTQTINSPSETDGRGLTPLSYWSYIQALVNRYKNSSALGMWEPMGEAEASSCAPQYEPTNCSGHQTCPNEAAAATALRYFYDTVGGEIHSLDPNHLVESGLLGGGQCGTQGPDYAYVSASPGIDVLSYHDYYGTAAMGGDQWNGLAVRFAQSAGLNKPIVGGEVGINAADAPGCTSLSNRNSAMEAKANAQFAAGSSALLLWDWVPDPTNACSFNLGPGDPILSPRGKLADGPFSLWHDQRSGIRLCTRSAS